jgi:multiple sugar transport system substrate-binding protein
MIAHLRSVIFTWPSFLKDRTIPRAAFVINPPSIWYWMVDNDKALLGNSEMASVPRGLGSKGRVGNAVGSWVWLISMAGKHQNLAKDWLRYFYQPDLSAR